MASRKDMAAAPNTAGGPRKTRSAANAITTAIAIIATLIGANVVGSRLFGRADLTEDQIYKLSKVSRDTVKNLPDRMNVKAFISGDLQPPLNTTAQYVRDLLDEYAAASGGKLVWEAIDPVAGTDKEAKDKAKDELGKYKIQKIALERISDTKLEIGSENYLGVGFAYGDQIEGIPSVTNTEGMEFQITSVIRRMVAAKKKKVGLAASEGELTQQQGLQFINQVLQDYEVTPVQLDKPIGDDIDALLVAGPKQPFKDTAKQHIDQFLMKGKPVAMFLDGMVVEAPQGMNMPGMEQPRIGRANDLALDDLLGKYGVKVNADLVLDRQNVIGLVPVNGQLRPANYPTFVAVTEEQLAKSDVTNKVKALVTPFASSVELEGELKEGKGEVKATPIAKSSKASWRNAGFFIFNPSVPLAQPTSEADKGPFVLGYALEGKLKSAFAGGTAESSPDGSLKESPPNGRLLVMGSSGILNDEYLRLAQYIPAYGQNALFVVNVVDWLLRDDSLITLRAKGAAQRPFTVSPETRIFFWRWMVELGVPAALIGLGLLLWFLRSARRASATI